MLAAPVLIGSAPNLTCFASWTSHRAGTSLAVNQSPITEYRLLVTGYWLLVTGYWLLVTDYPLLAAGVNSKFC
jgi:hypothetical protein